MSGLITHAANLATLVNYSCAARDEKIEAVRERELVALGSLAPAENLPESPENLGFGLFATMIGSMVSSSPEASLLSNGGRKERVAAAALAAATTQIARGSKIVRPLETCAWDFWFKPFVAGFVEVAKAQMSDLTEGERAALVGRLGKAPEEQIADAGGEADDVQAPAGPMVEFPDVPPHWPRFKRLNPTRCGWDMAVDSFDERRFTFHEVIEDRQVLLDRAEEADDDWYAGAIEAAPRCNLSGESRAGASLEENQYVRYFVVYVPGEVLPGEKPSKNNPGVIHTISATGVDSSGGKVAGMDLRKPYYFTGHPDGPHVFGGQYTTGHNGMFLNLLGAADDALTMLESASASLHQRIRDHKVVTAYDTAYAEEVQRLADAPSGSYVGIPNLGTMPGMLQQLETGAVTPAEVAEYRELMMNAQRTLGISNETVGNASDTTATAVAEAARQVDAKVEYLLERWNRFVGEALERMAFYVAMDDRVAVRLDDSGKGTIARARLAPLEQSGLLDRKFIEQVVERERNDPFLFQGGDFAEDGELDWYALRLEVKPSSMTGGQSRSAVQRELAWNMQLAQIGQFMLQMPHIDWIDRLKRTGRAMGVADVDYAVDSALAEQVSQMQLANGGQNYGTISQQGMQPPRQGALPQMQQPQGVR